MADQKDNVIIFKYLMIPMIIKFNFTFWGRQYCKYVSSYYYSSAYCRTVLTLAPIWIKTTFAFKGSWKLGQRTRIRPGFVSLVFGFFVGFFVVFVFFGVFCGFFVCLFVFWVFLWEEPVSASQTGNEKVIESW